MNNGFINAIRYQSATSEEDLIAPDRLAMAYPDHFDWLKDAAHFLPGKSLFTMKMRTFIISAVIYCSLFIIPMMQTSQRVVNSVRMIKQPLAGSSAGSRSCLLRYKYIDRGRKVEMQRSV